MTQTLEESVGQLIVGKVPAKILDDDNKDCLKRGITSGITIFSENVESREQVVELTDAVRLFSRHPAIIAVDQEGGAVQRLEKIITPIPSMMALGKLNDKERLDLVIGLAGKQMRLLGINCVFAPVLDVNTNARNPIIGTRSFGSIPTLVADLGATVIKSYIESGVLPVAKHFPGHGDSDVDSHLALPKLNHDMQRLEEIELLPFRENLLIAPAMMVAHLWITALNEQPLPASLSPEVISNLLRDQMGYQNLLFSDDMLMKAIGNEWGLEEACVRAVAAGLDMLLVCSNAEDGRKANAAIVQAVQSGRIPEERIQRAIRTRQAALNKIPAHDEMEHKRRLAVLEKSVAASDPIVLDTSFKSLHQQGSPRRAFAVAEPIHLFVPQHDRYPLNFREALLTLLPEMEIHLVEHRYKFNDLSDEQCAELAAKSGQNCVLFTFRAVINRQQLKLAEYLEKHAPNRLLVACDIPYDLDVLPEWENAVAIHDPSDLGVRAFAQLIARQLMCHH